MLRKALKPFLKIFICFNLVFFCSSFFFKKNCDFSQTKKSLSNSNSNSNSKALLKKGFFCLSQAPPDSNKGFLILENLLKKALQGKDFQLAKKIEKKLAEHSFYVLKDYNKAIRYYSDLLKRALEPGENFIFQYQIADSFFKLKKDSQALIELEKCFFKGISLEQEKKALLLKLSILIFQENFTVAERILKKKLESSFAPDFLREHLALVYESQKKFLKAVEELKKIKKSSIFIEQKIERLMERQSNQPGF